jgi:hypothetical protein
MNEWDFMVWSCWWLNKDVQVLRQISSSIESNIILNPPIDKVKAVGNLIDSFVWGKFFPTAAPKTENIRLVIDGQL